MKRILFVAVALTAIVLSVMHLGKAFEEVAARARQAGGGFAGCGYNLDR